MMSSSTAGGVTRRRWAGLPGALFLAGVFLLVVAVRFWVINGFSTQIPFSDQWLSEWPLLRSVSAGHFRLADLFAPINEHRIVGSRILQVLTFLGNNRQWDAQVLMTVNALLGGLLAVQLLVLFGNREFTQPQVPGTAQLPDLRAAALVLALWASPLLWHNTIWAFQTPFNLMPLFSFAGMALVLGHAQFTARWWAGMACLLAAIFSLGSGLLAPLSVAAVALVQRRGTSFWRGNAVTVLLCLAMVGCMLALRVESHAGKSSQAADLGEFAIALSKNLSFPWPQDVLERNWTLEPLPVEPNHYWWAMLIWVPAPLYLLACLFGARGFRGRELAAPRTYLFLAAILWVYGHIVLLAYLRGMDAKPPSMRHYEIYGAGLLLNLACFIRCAPELFAYLGKRAPRLNTETALRLSTAVYIALLGGGIFYQVAFAARTLANWVTYNRAQEHNLSSYVRTGDVAHLNSKPKFHLPLPIPAYVRDAFNDPLFVDALPASIREPLAWQPVQDFAARSGSFQLNALPSEAPPYTKGDVWSNWRADLALNAAAPSASVALWQMPGSRLPNIMVPYYGQFFPGDSVRLTVISPSAGKHEIQLPPPPHQGWGVAVLPAAPDVMRLLLSSQQHGWVAIAAPVEVGSLSWRLRQLRLLYPFLAVLGIFCITLAVQLSRSESPAQGGDNMVET